jgi:hypothetical protein
MKKLMLIMLIIALWSINAAGMDVTLSWDSNDDASYYKIFYGDKSGDYRYNTPNIKESSFTITGLEDKQYFFSVKAYNECGNSSEFSDEVTNQIPGKITGVIMQTCITYEQ